MRFDNKAVIITGAANGLGLDAAHGFAREGARVLMVDRDPRGADAAAALAAQGYDVRFRAADVTQDADVRGYVAAAMQAWGRVDCFFNNAGIEGHVRPLIEQEEAMFDAVIAVNVKGVFLGMKHVLPVMLAQGGGAVVNTASTAALVGSAGLGPYVASKHAVLGMTKTAAGEVARGGVRVNALCPGPTDTRMIHSLEDQAAARGANDVAERYKAAIPMGRYCTPAEVTAMVLFLCSDEASGITGGQFQVDGGRTACPGGSAWR
ncbi:glucose 1-dehydrogenase [Sediminicoccus sp. KRV36]|uniref:SDR family NAD(P)-dependent oxidoreductase n=1 Tax=Sediminicoccus sp. KRV36 TaxID=3133721 RepID=UPI00200F0FC4|nr:glucose 1-dehydrogenase [Sediminicoccus rosea]UPY35376.1 glucose 1-dehydrogenase [Sediminicoccus rosea]